MEQIIYIKMDSALNNLQRLICHKTHPNLFFMNTFFKLLKKIYYLPDIKKKSKTFAYHFVHIQCSWNYNFKSIFE